jgi:hypothetical protein
MLFFIFAFGFGYNLVRCFGFAQFVHLKFSVRKLFDMLMSNKPAQNFQRTDA